MASPDPSRSIGLRWELFTARRCARRLHRNRRAVRMVARLVELRGARALSSAWHSRHSNSKLRRYSPIAFTGCGADALTCQRLSPPRGIERPRGLSEIGCRGPFEWGVVVCRVGRTGCQKVVYEGTGFELRHPLTGKDRQMAEEPQPGVEENFN